MSSGFDCPWLAVRDHRCVPPRRARKQALPAPQCSPRPTYSELCARVGRNSMLAAATDADHRRILL
jgi:hypothetical protein